MTFPRIQIGRPQRLAALLLLIFLAQCLWVVGHQQLSTTDYRFARCGREMWERPSPLAGYFTTCGNLNGDGTFAYRIAGFPLTATVAQSLRPFPQFNSGLNVLSAPLGDVSIGRAIENFTGAPFGSGGTMTAAAIITLITVGHWLEARMSAEAAAVVAPSASRAAAA